MKTVSSFVADAKTHFVGIAPGARGIVNVQ